MEEECDSSLLDGRLFIYATRDEREGRFMANELAYCLDTDIFLNPQWPSKTY